MNNLPIPSFLQVAADDSPPPMAPMAMDAPPPGMEMAPNYFPFYTLFSPHAWLGVAVSLS